MDENSKDPIDGDTGDLDTGALGTGNAQIRNAVANATSGVPAPTHGYLLFMASRPKTHRKNSLCA